MNVSLVEKKGSSKRRTWQLHHKDTIVGRRRDCDLRILSAEVSRRHCVLSIDDQYVNVEDLDSINGTFVNGSRVVGRQVVRPGDHLQIGPLEFTVEYELQPGPDRVEQQRSDEQEVYDVLPALEEDRKSAQDKANEDEEAPLAMLDDVEDASWHLPETNELRDLLSQIEQPESRPQSRER